MKRFLLIIVFLFPLFCVAQNASSYCFSASTRTYAPLTAGTDVSGLTDKGDDEVSDITSLPFNFIFGGQTYSQVIISSNGWLSFVTPSITNIQNFSNGISNAALIKPILMPLWDDLANNNRPQYFVSGVAPNRVFKVEWPQQKWDYQSKNDVIYFQIWLYETSNIIEYAYSQGSKAVENGSATIGIYDAANTYQTLNNSGANPSTSSTNFTTSIDTKPASNQVYRFSPPVAPVPSSSVGTYTFCIDNTNTQNTANVSSGRYATVNVVKGFNYTFSVGDVFTSDENLTLLDDTNTNFAPPVTASGNTGTSITWTATISGAIRVLLSNTCSSAGSGPITLQLNSVGNTQDAQTAFGTDKWVGHVYNHTDGPPPGGATSPSSPSTTTSPFITANYVGYYNIATETINEDFGGNTACFPVLSNGVARTNIYTELFSVRYRMKSTRPAGCYLLNVNGDDGVRVYVDGVKVFDQWRQQGNTSYCNNLIYLNGNSDIILDYYEHQGGNVVGFSLTPFDGSSNVITSSSDVKVCSGVSPGLIDAAAFGSCTGGANGGTNTIYQWQVSTDNITFTDVSGANTEDYTPVAATTTTSNIIRYYRRSLKAFASNASSCVFYSNSVKVTTSPSVIAPTANAGTGATCSQLTANWSASVNTLDYFLDVSTVNTFATFVTGFNNLNVGNVTTYNVTGLAGSTNYFYRVRARNGCGTSVSSSTITYATISTSAASPATPGAITGTTQQCPSLPSQTYSIIAVTNATSYTWSVPAGWTITAGTGTTSITVTTGMTGQNGNIAVTATNTCGSNVARTLAVTVGPVTPVIGTITPSSCTSGGSVVLNSLPSGAWTLTQNDGATNTSISGSGSSYAVTGLAVGNYTFKVSNGTCTSLSSSNVNISSSIISTTWNGSGWSNGAPNSNVNIIFDGYYSSSTDLVGCSCQVNTGRTVVFNPGNTLKVINQVAVLGTGKLTFEDQASLVQEKDVLSTPNFGNITYKRITTTIVRTTDYTYWSTPVSPLNLAGAGGISYNPNTLEGSVFYSYRVTATSEDWQREYANSTMVPGQGYIIRGSGPLSGVPPNFLQATFVGVPNNGIVAVTVDNPDASYLLGNPYPSAINADTFLIDNSKVLDGTLYFWTHNTQVGIGVSNPGSGAYAYSGDDYASYNLTGGTGTQQADSDPSAAGMGKIPKGKIAAGQGFVATSIGTGSIIFNNKMRVFGTSGNNAQFFKQSSVKGSAASVIEKNRVWLNFSNEQGAFKQTLVGYVTNATNDYDRAFDGETYDGQEFVDFYSVNQGKKLVIQGRALPFDKADEVPLGYRTAVEGDFTISIDQADGVLANQSVFLEDKLTDTFVDLSSGNYTFSTAIGTFDDRFVLRYTNKTLGVEEVDSIEKGIYVSNKNKLIKINSTTEAINKVQIYDLSGKLVYQKTKINSNELLVSNLVLAHQVLVVKISLLDGVEVTRKLMF